MSNQKIETPTDNILASKDLFDANKAISTWREDIPLRQIHLFERWMKVLIGTTASIFALIFVGVVILLLIDNIGNKDSALSKVDDYRLQFFYISASFVSILGIFVTIIGNVFGGDKDKNRHIGISPIKNAAEAIEQS